MNIAKLSQLRDGLLVISHQLVEAGKSVQGVSVPEVDQQAHETLQRGLELAATITIETACEISDGIDTLLRSN